MKPTYITVKEAADIARCTTRTIWRWIGAGILPARKPRGRWLIPLPALRRLLGS